MTLTLLLATVLMAVSFYGWGTVVRRTLGLATPRAINLALGVAVMVVVGGGLICFSAVNAVVIIGLLFGGVLIALLDLSQSWRELTTWQVWRHHLGTVIAAPLVFWIHHAPTDFNIHDDIEKYLKHPVRLLATGNLQTRSYDALGAEALGGMSFLHAFPLAMGPIEFVNVMDDVIGLLACTLMVGAMGRYLRVPWGVSVATCLLVLMIDPLKANVSASYVGAALLMGMFVILSSGRSKEPAITTRQAAAVGLLCAGLVALKTSLALLLPIQFIALALVGILLSQDRAELTRRLLVIPLTAGALAAPWIWVHIDKFAAWARHPGPATYAGTPSGAPPAWEPFSTASMNFGFQVGHAHYTLLVIGYLALSVWMLRGKRTRSLRQRWLAGAIGIGISVNYIIGQGFGAPRLVGYENGLRYDLPLFLLGALLFLMVWASATKERSFPDSRKPRVISLGVLAVLIVAFVPSALARYQQGATFGFTRALPARDYGAYLDYHAFLRSASAQARLREVQSHVPAGEPVLVWTTMGAFHLDYVRNEIWDMDPAGLTGPWLRHPFGDPMEQQVAAMRDSGIRYVIWQYAGPGFRDEAYLDTMAHSRFQRDREIFGRAQLFNEFLATVSSGPRWAETVYEDGTTRVLRLRSGA